MMSSNTIPGPFDWLRPKPLTRVSTAWGHGIVDGLNLLYGWLTDGKHDINVRSITALYGHIDEIDIKNVDVVKLNAVYGYFDDDVRMRDLYARYGFFDARIYSEGRPVLRDGDPITVTDLGPEATKDITTAIDQSTVPTKLDEIYGRLQEIEKTLEESKAVQSSIETAVKDIDSRVSRIETYTAEIHDVAVKIALDPYGRVQVSIAEPIDEYGRVKTVVEDAYEPVSTRGSISASENVYGFSIVLNKGGRPNVNVYYRCSNACVVNIYVSTDGMTWRRLKSMTLNAPGEGIEILQGIAYPWVKVETPTTYIDVEFEVVASR